MADHTPGPWNIGESQDIDGSDEKGGAWIIGLDDEIVVAGGSYEGLKYGVLDHANARLISATPDLLEAAKRAFAYLEIQAEKLFNEKKATNGKSSVEDYMAPEALLLRSAIHKAEGLIFE